MEGKTLMANHSFTTWMNNTIQVLNDRAIAAGLIDPNTEKIVYRLGSPTNGYGHYVAVKELANGGERQIMYFDTTVKRDAFRSAVSAYSHAIECTRRAMTGQDFRL